MDTKLHTLLERGLGKAAKVSSQHSADHVIRAMAKEDASAALVVDAGKVHGIITEHDLVQRVLTDGRRPSAIPASTIMSTPVHTVEPDLTVRDALYSMAARHTPRLVVVSNGEPVGTLTERDLWMWAARDLEHEVGDLTDYICGRASSVPPPPLPAIGQEERTSEVVFFSSPLPSK